MTDASPAPAAAGPRRFAVLALALGPLLLIGIGAVVRGTWADDAERNPAGVADAAVSQLLSESGRVVVRAAVVIDRPIADVWTLLTDYDRFVGLFPYMQTITAKRRPDGVAEIRGVLSSRLWGDYTFESEVHHEQTAERCVAAWDHPGGDLRVNRGRWVLVPRGERETLLALEMQIEVGRAPQFMVHNVLLSRTRPVMEALREQARSRFPH